MSAPPAKKSKESTTISMIFSDKEDCLSPVTRINGYPWCLRLRRQNYGTNRWEVFVRCEKSMESELWNCEANIKSNEITEECHHNDKAPNSNVYLTAAFNERKYKFESTDKNSQEHQIGLVLSCVGNRLDVDITPTVNGSKLSLASQSPYFDRLFNGDFKEKSMNEIPIGDVSAEEFTHLLRMFYGTDDGTKSIVNAELTRENVHKVLQLADRFELKVVEDGVVNVLLSSSSPFSIHERFLIADKHGLTMCKYRALAMYTGAQLADLYASPLFRELSEKTKDDAIKKMCDVLRASSRN